jgi:hypothetical protein
MPEREHRPKRSRTFFRVVGYVALALLAAWLWTSNRIGRWPAAVVTICIVIVLAERRTRSQGKASNTLTIDDHGIVRTFPGGKEAVSWQELEAVRILTTADGPYAEDVVFVLFGSEGRGCAVPHGLAVQEKLLEHLRTHLVSWTTRRSRRQWGRPARPGSPYGPGAANELCSALAEAA